MPIADRTACSTIGLKPTQDIFVFVYIQHSKKKLQSSSSGPCTASNTGLWDQKSKTSKNTDFDKSNSCYSGCWLFLVHRVIRRPCKIWSAELEPRHVRLEVEICGKYLRRGHLLFLEDDLCAGGTDSTVGRASCRHNTDRNNAVDTRRSSEGLGAGRWRRRVDRRDSDEQRRWTTQFRRWCEALVKRLASRTCTVSTASLLAATTLET